MMRSRLVPLIVGALLLLLIVVGALWLWPGEPQVAEDAPPSPGEQEPPEAVEPPLAEAPEPATPSPQAESAEAPTGATAPGPEVAEPAPQPAELAEAAEELAEPGPEAAAGDEPGETLEPVPPAGESPADADVAAAQPEDTSTAPAQAPDLSCADGATACTLAQEVLNAVPPAPDGTPEILLNQPDGVYLDQEYLVVEVAMPGDLGGYLYLDVLTEAGEVFHLLPEPLREDNQLEAGAMIRVGVEEDERAAGVRHWQVSAPFGPGYLLAVVSEDPLYEGLRPVGESLDSYRPVLLDGLDGGAGGQAAQVVPLEFRPN